MSYPWWHFRVAFRDGTHDDFVATGLTVSDALHELTDVTYGPDVQDDFSLAVKAHGEPRQVTFLGRCTADGEDEETGGGARKVVPIEEVTP